MNTNLLKSLSTGAKLRSDVRMGKGIHPMRLNHLDNSSLSALKTALDGYQQFTDTYPEPAKYFRSIIEHLFGRLDGLNLWSIRELVNKEEDRRRSTDLAVISSDVYERINQLSDHELRILKLLAQGYENVEVANLLSISYRTIATHKANITTRLGLGSAHQLTRFAIAHVKFL